MGRMQSEQMTYFKKHTESGEEDKYLSNFGNQNFDEIMKD